MLQPNEFKIYNASAGAGKTYTLVKEYLSILLSNPNPSAFESILAITFTNKAANEMKERILQQLLNFSKPDFQSNSDLMNLSEELKLEPEKIHEKSKGIITKILHNYSRFSVSTIDKFNLRLMKSFAQDMGLTSNFNVEMDLNLLLENAVNMLYSKIGEDELLTSVLIENALDNLNENRSWDITRELIKNSETLYADKHLVNLAMLQKFSLKEFNEFRKTVFQNVKKIKNNLVQTGNSALNLIESNGIQIDDFAYGKTGFIGFFIHLANERFDFPGNRHTNFKEITDSTKFTSAKASSYAETVIPEIVPQLIELSDNAIELLKNLALWEGIQKTIVSLSVINEVEKSLKELKSEQNIIPISEFNKIISENLREQPSGFIYERIGNRFHHYFIDEFQDTSQLQWENFNPLLENARSTSDTIMLVGDPKQSIYRWRGGNPDLMINLVETSEQQNVTIENLPKNWRSFDQIIDFNNHFYTFCADSISDENYKNLYRDGNKQTSNHKKGGYVEIQLIERENTEQYIEESLEKILEYITNLLNLGFDYQDIAIIHRTKNHGKIIADFLAENQIPLISSESLLVKNSPEIQILEQFFKWISNPEDLQAKSSFLIQLNHYKNLISEDFSSDLKNLIHQNKQKTFDFLKLQEIDLEFVNQPSISLYDFCEKSIQAFGFGENSSSGNSYLMAFLDFILEFSNQNEYSLSSFLEHWEEKKNKLSISLPEGLNAVQLMTIHKAKGLEFQAVILPFADWENTVKYPKFWIPVEDKELPVKSFMMDSFQSGKLEQISPEIAEIIQKERLDFEMENLNLLYVATTRAVEQLYIISEKLKPNSKREDVSRLLNDFVAKENPQNDFVSIGNQARISVKSQKSLERIKIPLEFTNWEEKILISKESSKRWKKKKEIVYGELIHELMASVKIENDIEKTIENALISGLIKENEKLKIQELMNQIVQHSELKNYFQNDLVVFTERDFVDENGEIFRPDRIILNGNSCTIIDYKTGGELPKHIAQVDYYAENLEKSGYEIENKFLVYVGEEISVKRI